MTACEIERRFEMAVESFRREVARRGIYSDEAGPVRSFSRRKIHHENLARSLEGALARCCGVPAVSVTLKDGFHFDKDAFETIVICERYIEADYICISESYLVVAVHIRKDNFFETDLRTIPLNAIWEVGVLYGERLGRKYAA